MVEGSVLLHGFAFLWGHCRNLRYMKIGHVVSNEVGTNNVLSYDVWYLLFQVRFTAQHFYPPPFKDDLYEGTDFEA